MKYRKIETSKDKQLLQTIISQSFGVSTVDVEHHFNRIGEENFRLLEEAQEIKAGLAIYNMGQWYGGKSVPMAGIAAVGVAPEHRGKGIAKKLLQETILELYQQKTPISALHPATQVLYRHIGYQQAGSYCQWELPITNLKLPCPDLPMYPVNPSDYQIFEHIYTQKAKSNNGNLDRTQAIWEKIPKSYEEETIYAYIIGEKTQPEGYVIFTQEYSPEFILKIRDWAVLTPKATQRFWAFMGYHRSLIKQIHWYSGLTEPSLILLPEQTAKIKSHKYWMLRIIDLPSALEKRGYPPKLTIELHIEVKDDIISNNNGRFCLKVAQGKGEITKGGKGELQIDIRNLASIYTGFYSPHQLEKIGYIQAKPEALTAATLIFAGPNPWMSDMF